MPHNDRELAMYRDIAAVIDRAATALELGNARLAGEALHDLARGFDALAIELEGES